MANTLALITARGGSKGIPRKNVLPLAGKPLLAYSCEAALGCPLVTRTILSTDDQEIAEVGREWGVEVPFMRPDAISGDTATSFSVIEHALDWLRDNESWQPEAVILLQPTSPLRTSTHVHEALELMESGNADTVVSVTEVPHRFSPFSIMKLDGECLKHFWEGPLPFDRFRRQEQPKLYARNGPSILITRTTVLRERKGFYGDRILPYLMSAEESVDIDSPFDFELIEWLMQRRERLSNSV